MFERTSSSQRVIDLAEEPCRGFGAILRFVVARVEGGKGLEVVMHVGFVEVFEHWVDSGVVRWLRGIGHFTPGGRSDGEAKILGICDIHEVEALLRTGQH